MSSEADAFLDVGDSSPAVKLKDVGDRVKGKIVRIPEKPIERKGLDDKMEITLPITIETGNGETGLETLWVQKFGMRKAIKAACDEVAPGTRLAVGGTLAIALTEKVDVKKPSPMSVFKAKYEPPAAAASDGVDDFFGE